MKRMRFSIFSGVGIMGAILLAMAFAGCDGAKNESASLDSRPTIRIKAGIDEPLTDSQGIKWAADAGYDEGTEVDREDLQITGTNRPELYRSERYSMNSYSFKVPNGDYTLKLHFSEDYDGIASPADRLFTYAVKDGNAGTGRIIKEVKEFSPWKASGDHFKAYVDTVPVKVTQGAITITFTPEVENPQINAIEIVPR
jgi:hypothetical protein